MKLDIRNFGKTSFVYTKGLVERIKEEERKMTEHLFKLKKDGKTVGYLELLIRTPYGYPVLWFRNLGRLDEGKEWHSGNNVQADSIHPFVTKDKNGKDVFVGDRIKRINGEPCFVEWYAGECRYILHNNQNNYDIDVFELEQGIELIEERKMSDNIIYEAECPACGEIVEFTNIGWKICPHCKTMRAEFAVKWEIIEEKK